MEVVLSGKEKDIKALLKNERLWLKRNAIEVSESVDSKSIEKELNSKKMEVMTLQKKIKKLEAK